MMLRMPAAGLAEAKLQPRPVLPGGDFSQSIYPSL